MSNELESNKNCVIGQRRIRVRKSNLFGLWQRET